MDDSKLEYMKKHYIFTDTPGEKTIPSKCEFCKTPIETKFKVSKNHRGWAFSSKGIFSNDISGEIHLYCNSCNNKIHDWSELKKWLSRISREVDDLKSLPTFSTKKRHF